MDDGREELNGIDRALAEALDVEVSPEFAARVRQRIAGHPMRPPRWAGWRIAAATAAALLVVAGFAATFRSSRATPATVAARTLPAARPVPDAMGPAPSKASRAIEPVANRQTPHNYRVAASVPAAAEPEVLVPREDIEMYQRLIALAGRTPPAVVVEARPVDVLVDRTWSGIQIDPITIELMAPPAGAEGERQ